MARRFALAAIIAGLLLVVPLVASGQGTVIQIDVERDIIINGEDPFDYSGTSTAVGDVNNDNIDDLIIGAPLAKNTAGQTYVIFGPRKAGTLELATDPDIVINGIDVGDQSGIAVAVGDINHNGVNDLIIGANRAGGTLNTPGIGETYVIFGPLTVGTLELSTAADVTVNGTTFNGSLGSGVAAGDIDRVVGDDLIIGASGQGQVYVIPGPLTPSTITLSAPAIVINGPNDAGADVAVGDIDSDGADDLIVGAPRAGGTERGQTFVLFGPLGPGTLQLPTDSDITVNGATNNDLAGAAVAAGDANNDGIEDLMIGAWNANFLIGQTNAGGRAYVLDGPLAAGTFDVSVDADTTLNGRGLSDGTGTAVAIGDINNDGAEDMVVGASSTSVGQNTQIGQTSVLFGVNAVCTPAPSNLVSWWTLDGFSIQAADIAGANHGTRVNFPTSVKGMVGVAVKLNGTDQYVTVPDAASLDLGTSDMSVDAWVRPDTATGTRAIIEKRDPTTGQGFALYLKSNEIGFAFGDAASSTLAGSGATVPTGVWSHVAVTVDRSESDGAKIYVDGALVHTFDPTSFQGDIGTSTDLQIGLGGPTGEYFSGTIDEVELFNRALSATEVQNIFGAGGAGKCKYTCTNSVESSILAGNEDAFITTDGTEPTSPGTTLQAFLDARLTGSRVFDQPGSNLHFGHTFENLPAGIVAAELLLRLKAQSGDASNDGINLETTSTSTFACNVSIGSLPEAAGAWTVNEDAGFNLNLDALPLSSGGFTSLLSSINADHALDVYLSDDTAVDFLKLITLVSCGSADLSVTKTHSPVVIGLDGTLTYTVTVTNNGPDPASGVTLTDVLGKSTLLSASPSQGTCPQTPPIICDLGTIADGDDVVVTIQVTPDVLGSVGNKVTVTSSVPDPDDTDNFTQITTEVLADEDLPRPWSMGSDRSGCRPGMGLAVAQADLPFGLSLSKARGVSG